MTKPAVMVALVVAALLLHPTDGAVRAWVVAGLVCSLAGDVFLMLPRERFVEGLASFLAAHVAYIVAFLVAGTSSTGAAIGVAIVVVGVALMARPILRSVQADHAAFAVPVLAYVSIISVMVVAAWASANPWAIAGAMSFYASDGILAWNKFVKPDPGRPLRDHVDLPPGAVRDRCVVGPMSARARRVVALPTALILGLTGMLAACGGGTRVDVTGVERTITAKLEHAYTPARVGSTTCPASPHLAANEKFRCSTRIAGHDVGVTVTLRDTKGAISFTTNPRRHRRRPRRSRPSLTPARGLRRAR